MERPIRPILYVSAVPIGKKIGSTTENMESYPTTPSIFQM